VRPFFPFYGSKWNIARHYPSPGLTRVIEPFAGGASYSCFYDCARVDLFDADPIIAGVWSFLMRATPAEIEWLPDMPEVGDHVDNYKIPQEAKWLIGFWLNRGSATPKKSRTAYSARTDKAQLNWGPRAKERIITQLPMLAGWTITNADYSEAPDVEATWFVDPPYGDKGKFYRIKFNEFDDLGEWVLERQGKVIACEGPGATWLPFKPLGLFKSSLGHATEMVYVA
jgi:site-specific DNA-adenine methylase